MFEAKLELGESADILRLSGDLAIDTVGGLRGIMKRLDERQNRPLVVDISKLEFIDSKGAAFLIDLNVRLKDRTVALASVPYMIKKVLSRLFIMEHFIIFKAVDEALRNIHRVERKTAVAV